MCHWPQALLAGPSWLVAGAGSSTSKSGLAPGEHVGVPSGQRGLQQNCPMGLGGAPRTLGCKLLAPGLAWRSQVVRLNAFSCVFASNRCHMHQIWHSGGYSITLLRRSGFYGVHWEMFGPDDSNSVRSSYDNEHRNYCAKNTRNTPSALEPWS